MISDCLQQFVAEARRADGTCYPPRTIFQLLTGLLRHSREVQSNPPNFLDRTDTHFKELHGACDATFRTLHQQGIGTTKKSADIITQETEDMLWDRNVLDTTDPDKLQKAVFFYIGKVCCLRGGEEQRQLKLSQFVRCSNPDRYVYTEHGSKNRNGGFYQLHVDNKTVQILRNSEAGKRCLFSLLELYMEKLPPEAKKNDIFYCRPLQCFKDKEFWYSAQPRGKHFLNNMVKSMFQEANIPGNFTNHSLRASGATELFRHEVPEKIIQEHTGHRSVGSLRQYEKVGLEQKQATCNILIGSGNDFNTEVQKIRDGSSVPGHSLSMLSYGKSVDKLPLQLPSIAPVFSNQGVVNFTVNISPAGTINIGNTVEADDYDELLKGIELKDLID